MGSDDGAGVGEAVVGSSVGRLLGANEGNAVVVAVGAGDGRAVGALLGVGVGIALGTTVGKAVGLLVVGWAVVGTAVGAGVGAYVTSCTPAPATTAIPEHVDDPKQPSWIKYV